jgi:peptidoglycan/LPS O-acetylase OafA/YrhL
MKLGEWSFAIYMVHYIVMCVLPALGLQESPWLACLAGIGGSIAVGALAWRFVERPLAEALRRKLLNVSGQSRAPRT